MKIAVVIEMEDQPHAAELFWGWLVDQLGPEHEVIDPTTGEVRGTIVLTGAACVGEEK